MDWQIDIRPKAREAFKKLDKIAQRRIDDFIQKKLRANPMPRKLGAPLSGKLSGLWKYRIGDYRLICEIKDATVTILVLNIGHRREIYKKI